MKAGRTIIRVIWVVVLLAASCSSPTVPAGSYGGASVDPEPAAETLGPVRPQMEEPAPVAPAPVEDQPPPNEAGGNAVWPMFRFDLRRTSYNPNERVAAPPLDLVWEYETTGKI